MRQPLGTPDSTIGIYIPDLRGHGRSKLSHPGDVTYVGQLEHDLEDLRTQIQDNSRMAMLAGHSSGGGLVVRYGGIRRAMAFYCLKLIRQISCNTELAALNQKI